MAGDFVMVQHATARKIELRRVAAKLGIPHAHALGLCVLAWMFFDEQTADGRAEGATLEMLDEVVGHSGFSHALRDVGWLRVRDGSLEVPNFERLMGESAKKRANDATRQRRKRARDESESLDDEELAFASEDRHEDVTHSSRSACDKNVTKEEKRRVKKREENTHTHTRTREAWLDHELVRESPELQDAIRFWCATFASTHGHGRDDDDIRIEMRLAEARSKGWDAAQIVRSIRFSVTKLAKSWLDPDADFETLAKDRASGARRPKAEIPITERC